MKTTTYFICGINQILYNLFGINTPSRKAWIEEENDKLQVALDKQRRIRDMVNERTDGSYTTKEAIKIAVANDWI